MALEDQKRWIIFVVAARGTFKFRVSIDAQNYPALTSQSLRATIGPLQDNWPLFHYVIEISGILPYNRNVALQTLEFFSAYARLYNAAASPASRLRSAGSLAIIPRTRVGYELAIIHNCEWNISFVLQNISK